MHPPIAFCQCTLRSGNTRSLPPAGDTLRKPVVIICKPLSATVPHQQWQRGRVVEPQYRDDRYWVTDWRARQLSAPPPDHRWLRINGDYVLVAIATGVITSILTGY
ncbi:RcnB family protein [Pseudomonas sp. S32]|nr:RcnB family protein [Pseudomonas sp. S32]